MSRGRLVVIELGERRIDDEVTGTAHFQAKVDIVESHGQTLFVEPAHFVKDIAARQETGSGHGTVIARDLELSANPGIFRAETAKGMLRNPSHAEDHTRMLHRIVRIEQSRTDGTYLRSLHVFNHRTQPFALDYFDVVIQKEKPG